MNLQKQTFLIILFTVCALMANAKNYYFSAISGNDTYTSAQAQSTATPWKTLAKVNSFFANFVAGDSILFKCGEVFDGNIVVSKSGTVALPIIFASYGTGAKPVINGFTTLSSWTSLGGGIYQSNCAACGVAVNTVAVNGIQQGMGRYPNTGYLTYQTHVGAVSITDATLAASPNWTGAEVVIKKAHWIIDRNPIISQVGGIITYTPSSTYNATDNYGYFIQNDARTLDQLGEWYYNPTTKNMQMFFGAADPNTYVVKAGVVGDIVYINKNSNITFLNLSFLGANVNAFNIGAAPQISILNCNIDQSGTNAVWGQNTGISSANFRLENTTINHTNNNAVLLPSEFTSASVKNNLIKNSGVVIGMSNSGDNTCQGIIVNGSNTVVQYNELDSVGYAGITFYGTSISIKNNLINHFCVVKDDGGGIYTYKNLADPAQTGSEINGNIVLNGLGNTDGISVPATAEASGIYTDGYSAAVSVINNTVANCVFAGFSMSSNTGGLVANNLFFNNNLQINVQENNPTGNPYKNLSVNKNIFFSKAITQASINYLGYYNNLDPTFSADSNYYVRPFDDNALFTTTYTTGGNTFATPFDLPTWQTVYNTDKNSSRSPITIAPYKFISGLANQYTYGTFEGRTDLPSMGINNVDGDIVAAYDGTSKLDGVGSLKITFPITVVTTSESFHIVPNGPASSVSSTKNYLLKFSTIGVSKSRLIGVYLQQLGAPFTKLSATQYIKLPAARSENEMLFSFPISAAAVNIVFLLSNKDETLWVDNVQFFEANITKTNPDDVFRFEYNASPSPKVVTLDKPYIDVKNNYFTNKITIKPYGSVMLIDANAGCKCDKQVIQWKP